MKPQQITANASSGKSMNLAQTRSLLNLYFDDTKQEKQQKTTNNGNDMLIIHINLIN